MGTGHDPLSITKTLSGTTADTITIDQLWPYVQITNSDATNTIWVSLNGTATPTTAVAAAAGCIPILPLQTRIIQAAPIQNGTGVGTIVLSVVGNGGSYTVTGISTNAANLTQLDSRYTLVGTSLSFTPTALKTADYSAAVGEMVNVSTASANVTVTLPTAPADKAVVAVRHTTRGAGKSVTVACGGSDVFNKTSGVTTWVLKRADQEAIFQYQASTGLWFVVSDSISLAELDGRFAALGGDIQVTTPFNDATLDTALIVAAVAALPSTGGVIRLQAGNYWVNPDQIYCDSTKSVTFKGAGGRTSGATGRTVILCTGTGTGSVISAKSSSGFRLEDLQVLNNNSGFTGRLVDLRGSLGTDTANAKTVNVTIGGSGVRSAIGLDLEKCICSKFEDTLLSSCDIGIIGKRSGTYSIANTFINVTTVGCNTIGIRNPGTAWTLIGCTGEGLYGGTAGFMDHEAGVLCAALTIIGVETVDSDGGTAITVAGSAISIKGSIGAYAGTGVKIDEASIGVDLDDIVFDSCTLAIDIIDSASNVGINIGRRIDYRNCTAKFVEAHIVTGTAFSYEDGTGTAPAGNNIVTVDLLAHAFSNTNFNTFTQSGGYYNGFRRASSAAQNDEFVTAPVYMKAGTWQPILVHETGSNRGIYTVQYSKDATNWTTAFTLDGYAASGSVIRSSATTAPTIATVAMTAGHYYWRVKMATKNASSSSYFGAVSALMFTRTGV